MKYSSSNEYKKLNKGIDKIRKQAKMKHRQIKSIYMKERSPMRASRDQVSDKITKINE